MKNISLLKPLIKDMSKDTNSLGNLRPLSISDLYTSIFEKLVLMEIRKDHENVINLNENNFMKIKKEQR